MLTVSTSIPFNFNTNIYIYRINCIICSIYNLCIITSILPVKGYFIIASSNFYKISFKGAIEGTIV